MRTLTIVTEPFEALARQMAKGLGNPKLPLLVLPHPFGDLPEDELRAIADIAAPEVDAFVWEGRMPTSPADRAEGAVADEPEADGPATLTLGAADEVAAGWELDALGYGDGLPIVLPTPDRVAAMLACADVDPDTPIGPIPPGMGTVTVRAIAANAVMAGCEPRAFPVVLAAVHAALDERFNLLGCQVTTHPVGIGVLVTGPAAATLGLNAGTNLLGPGVRANMTIGRAVRMALDNGGNATARGLDKATMGQPGKISMCFAENLAESPWGPWRPSGLDAESAVTVIGGEGPHNINDHASIDADGLLKQIAGTMAITGSNNLVLRSDTYLLVCPEHAEVLASEGLSREDVQREVHARARVRAEDMSAKQLDLVRDWSSFEPYIGDDGKIPVVRTPEDVQIVVAGGEGKHSMWIPSFITYSCSRPLDGLIPTESNDVAH